MNQRYVIILFFVSVFALIFMADLSTPNQFLWNKIISLNKSSSSSSSTYVGLHNGRWEGYLLNQYNQGNAQFTVQKNGNAELRLSGEFNVTHKGQIKNDKFVTNNNQSCPIVDQGDRFKIVLIWTGVNVDVLFQK